MCIGHDTVNDVKEKGTDIKYQSLTSPKLIERNSYFLFFFIHPFYECCIIFNTCARIVRVCA